MITLIEAKNYRCLKYVCQHFEPFHVLVGPNAGGNLVLAEPMGDFQLTQKGGLLEHVKLPGAVAGQKLAEGILRRARPDVGLERIDTGTPGRLDPLVTVDEHKAGRGAGDHDDGQKLTAAHHRVGHLDDLPRPLDAGMSIGQIQMGDLNGVYGDDLGHVLAVADATAKVSRVISCKMGDWPSNRCNQSVLIEIYVLTRTSLQDLWTVPVKARNRLCPSGKRA